MNSEYTIRSFIPNDYEEVINLWNETGLNNPERGDSLQTILNTIQFEGVLLILENNVTMEIVGTSWVTNDGRRLYLHHFGIKPKFQGKKLAHILMKASLEFAKNKQLQIKLEVHQENKIAINLYQKASFNYLGAYKIYIIRNYQNI